MIVLILPKMLKKKLEDKKPLKLLIDYTGWFLITSIAYTVGMMFIENRPLSEAIWLTWQTFTTVGYGDVPATTEGGRALTMLASFAGIALFGVIISAYFDYTIDLKEKRRIGKLKSKFKGDYVIVNWPGEHAVSKYMYEIRAIDPFAKFCIIDPDKLELPVILQSDPNICFIRGSLFDVETYKQAQIQSSQFMAFFPENAKSDKSDATSLTAINVAKKYLASVNAKDVRMSCLIVNHKNRGLFNGVTLISIDFEVEALVQETHDPGTANIISSILSNTEGANPHTINIPDGFDGWSFFDFETSCNNLANKLNRSINVLAIMRGSHNYCCPKVGFILKKGDSVSILANSDLDGDEFLQILLNQDKKTILTYKA